jgi:2-polyprenyl-3-methyl-5-hydroxy-6-metoxy-1,4-benzoquinol methylase
MKSEAPSKNSAVKSSINDVAVEFQNQNQIDAFKERGPIIAGPWTSHIWRTDPRHLGFLLARYKFCAKMLAGKSEVFEVGCGDAFGTPVVLQTTKSVHCIDFEPFVLTQAKKCMQDEYAKRCTFAVHDMTKGPLANIFDAAYSLDVLEHIPPSEEEAFVGNVAKSLRRDGIVLFGTPNVEAHKHASEGSRLGHVNLKSGEAMRQSLARFFDNVFVFSMNDEVVHTGFSPMAHYIIGMGVGVRS